MQEIRLFYYRHNKGELATAIRPLSIAFYDLTLLLSGALTYSVNGTELTLLPGDALFLPPGTRRARKEGYADYVSFNFNCEEPLVFPTRLPGILHSETKLLISACDEIYRKTLSCREEMTGQILGALLCRLATDRDREKLNPLTVTILRYVHTHPNEKITLADIGRVTHYSAVYCDTVFKKDMGRSIIDYHIDARVTEAKNLLTEGSLSLSAVAAAVGFPDYNYFSRLFKSRIGYTPLFFRRMTIEKTDNGGK